MTKLDQLKALREGKSSRGSTESRRASVPLASLRSNSSMPTKASLRAGIASGPREAIRRPKSTAKKNSPATTKALAKASGESSDAGGMQDRCVSIPPPIRKGRPRIEDRDKTIEASAPWVALGMSRRSWYRRQAEKRAAK
jgi:hypothetical protein